MNKSVLNPTIKQFASKFSKGVYGKSLILTILTHCNGNAHLIHKTLKIKYKYKIGLRTVYKYLGELILCGRVTKYISLTDSRTKVYCLSRYRM